MSEGRVLSLDRPLLLYKKKINLNNLKKNDLVETAFFEVMVLFFFGTKTSHAITFELTSHLLSVLLGYFTFLLQVSNNLFGLRFCVASPNKIYSRWVKVA